MTYTHQHGINWIWFYPNNGDEPFRLHKGDAVIPQMLAESTERDTNAWSKRSYRPPASDPSGVITSKVLQQRITDLEYALHLIVDQAGEPDTEDFDIVRRECYGWSMCALGDIPIESRYDWTRFNTPFKQKEETS